MFGGLAPTAHPIPAPGCAAAPAPTRDEALFKDMAPRQSSVASLGGESSAASFNAPMSKTSMKKEAKADEKAKKRSTKGSSGDRLREVERTVNEVRDVMRENIDKCLQRAEMLDDLELKTEDLGAAAATFLKKADSHSYSPSRRSAPFEGLLLLDVTPLHMGFAHTCDNRSRWVMQRNTTIPCRKTAFVYAPTDGCTEIDLIVIEGLLDAADRNQTLAKIHFPCWPAAARGDKVGEIQFDLDANGILAVTVAAIDAATQRSVQGQAPVARVLVTNEDVQRLSVDDICRMVVDADREAGRKQRSAVLTHVPFNTTSVEEIRAWFNNSSSILEVSIDRCPSTGFCEGKAHIETDSEDALRALLATARMTLPTSVQIEPVDPTLWTLLDEAPPLLLSEKLMAPDALEDFVRAPEEAMQNTFLLFGVSATLAEAFADRGLADPGYFPVRAMADFVGLLMRDAQTRAKARLQTAPDVESYIAHLAPPQLSSRALTLSLFLMEYSILSDGKALFPYPVRRAPCVDSSVLDDATVSAAYDGWAEGFDYAVASGAAGCGVDDVYACKARQGGVSLTTRYFESLRHSMEFWVELHNRGSKQELSTALVQAAARDTAARDVAALASTDDVSDRQLANSELHLRTAAFRPTVAELD
jgi:hypothetical protein